LQTLKRSSGGVPVVSYQTAHHIPILLLHVTAIVLLVGTRPGKGNLLLATIGVETSVDELAAVVRVHTKESEGETLSHPVYCRTYSLLPFTPNRQAFRPAAGNVHSTERVQVKALYALTTVGYQIHFQEARLVLLPIGKGPDGYRALKQAPWPGSTQ
jgi:hypothetical protein